MIGFDRSESTSSNVNGFMHRPFLPILVLAAASVAAAQGKPTINVNYAWSNTFDLNGGGSGQIRGVEFGISQNVASFPLMGEARIGASALLGKTLGGSSVDGNVYRIFAWYKTPMSPGGTGVYGLGGIHWATAQAKNNAFDNGSGFGFDFGIGFPLQMGASLPGMPGAAIELIYHQGSRAQTRGFSVGVNVRF